VLDELVYNYSWPLFPYIWNEIKFQVAYNADLEFIARTMQKITEDELGKEIFPLPLTPSPTKSCSRKVRLAEFLVSECEG